MPSPTPTKLPVLRVLQSPNQSARSTQDVRLVVVHDPEHDNYELMVRYLRSRSAQVSYHVLLNKAATHATQLVPWNRKAWSVSKFNSRTDNVSITGRAGNNWSYPALNRLARVVAFRLHKRRLPARFVSAPIGLTNPARGFTFHSELGRNGGGHSDPGLTGAKKWFFIGAVKFHAKRKGWRAKWGVGD